ncbi:hypothetical protein L9F63_000627, partial [Diploptera punctata]
FDVFFHAEHENDTEIVISVSEILLNFDEFKNNRNSSEYNVIFLIARESGSTGIGSSLECGTRPVAE